ncbi:putative ribonuclease H-like domain-containing protein, partial [Tanacetum coccineum]
KENYADSKEQGISCDDVEDLDVQQFIVHGPKPMHPEERTAAKEVPLSSEEQALHDELVSLMHQESLAKAHNDDQRIAFEEEKRRISIAKGKEHVDSTFTLSTANTPPQRKWVFRNKRDERGTIIKNKARLVAQGYRQEEGVDYDEVFAPVARIEAIRLFLAFASFMGFIVYQMDVKSAFLYGNITEEVYVKQPPGFEDPAHPNKEFKMSSIGELTFFLGLQVKQTSAGIFLSQDKYVKDILNKFDFRTIKPASTPIEAHKSLGKDEEGEDVDVHLYRSMIGCLMYLTASRPDIMFAVCLCARFQVTPKVSHLHAVKRIFRYLKHQPKLGLWYPKDSPFHLEAFSDSDYAGDNHDRRSTSGGCQYLGRRLVSWQCKKQTIVAISSTEAEYVAAASCCAQVLWMQNQLLDYGFNFMNTEIHIDNESTICIVKNPVFHSKTKHIQIRHHFIRDCYEQRLINVVKVHTDDNVADLLTKGFDLARFNFLVLASPEQTATGKDLSNPFMVVMTYQKSYSIQHTMIHVLSVEVVFSSPWIITFSRSQHLKKQKATTKEQKKKRVFSQSGDGKEEGTLSEEHYVQDDYTADPFFEDIVDKDAVVTPDLEIKSDGTEEINIEEKKASDVRVARLQETGFGWQFKVTVDREPEEQFKVDEVLADISRLRGLSIPGPIQSQPQPQQPSQATDPKKIQDEWGAVEERKRFDTLMKGKAKKTTLRKPTLLAQERESHDELFLKGSRIQEFHKLKCSTDEGTRLLRKRKATISEEQPSKKVKLRTETVDELKNYLRIVDFEKNAQDRESWKNLMITVSRNQEDWEIVRVEHLNESSGSAYTKSSVVLVLIVHMLAERRYPSIKRVEDKDAGGTMEWNS